jgi:DNA-binding transcriptional ArsR family regulator
MEKLLSALGHKDRLRIVVWLIEGGAARQVEICQRLASYRKKPVNPGEVSALLRPLLDTGILIRERPRGPIAIRDPQQLVRLLQATAGLSLTHAESGHSHAESDSDELRRALFRQIPESDTGS